MSLVACHKAPAPSPANAEFGSAPRAELANDIGDASVSATQSDDDDGGVPESEHPTQVQHWPQPSLKKFRYLSLTDQVGCRWWLPLDRSTDEGGPYPVLGRDHRPICSDKDQVPDGIIEWKSRVDAASMVAKGDAVYPSKAAIASYSQDADDDEDSSDATDNAATAASDISAAASSSPPAPAMPAYKPTYPTIAITTRGQPAISLGNFLAITNQGKMAVQVGSLAIPLHH